MGGRTDLEHVHRIFSKERPSGSSQVQVVLRRGSDGVAFCNAYNSCETYPEVPPLNDDRYVLT